MDDFPGWSNDLALTEGWGFEHADDGEGPSNFWERMQEEQDA